MKEAVFVNTLIILLVAFVILVTKNPLAMFALTLLRELPYGLIAPPEPEEPEEPGYESRKIGFHAE